MPPTKPTERGNVLIRRFSTNRPRRFVGSDDNDDLDDSSEILSSRSDYEETQSISDPSQALSPIWDIDETQQAIRGYDEFANKLLLPDETTLMIRKFQRAEDIAFGRVYQLGRPVSGFYGNVFRPNVGIVLLPGADLPEVNRREQAGMVSGVPDQRDALWRVNTAGEMYGWRSLCTSNMQT